jgi:hypothetical protein
MLAIAWAMAVLCALHPIPNRGARPRAELFIASLSQDGFDVCDLDAAVCERNGHHRKFFANYRSTRRISTGSPHAANCSATFCI